MSEQTPIEVNDIRREAAGNLAFLLSVVRCGESLSPDEESNVHRVIRDLQLSMGALTPVGETELSALRKRLTAAEAALEPLHEQIMLLKSDKEVLRGLIATAELESRNWETTAANAKLRKEKLRKALECLRPPIAYSDSGHGKCSYCRAYFHDIGGGKHEEYCLSSKIDAALADGAQAEGQGEGL